MLIIPWVIVLTFPFHFSAFQNGHPQRELQFNGHQTSGSSEPMAVPLAHHHTEYEEQIMNVVDNGDMSVVLPAPSTSHKSNYSTTQSVSLSDNPEESLASVEDEEKISQLLLAFDEPDRSAVRRISAASNAEDLGLMVKLFQQGYFKDNTTSSPSCTLRT